VTAAVAVRQQDATNRIQFTYDHPTYSSGLSSSPTLVPGDAEPGSRLPE